jgi:acyl carrier protein
MTDRVALRATLVAFLEEETGNTYPDLTDETCLRDGLGLDSVDLVGTVMRVENHFRIRLEQQELAGLTTVGSLVDLVAAKSAAPRTAAA